MFPPTIGSPIFSVESGEHGVFGALMDVSLVNDGPVTIVLDSKVREDGTLKGVASSPADLQDNAAASGDP
nr:unnamed protein product [Spirometra erinaceieuropaei]